ncbi:MAG: hypothetical protein QOD32_1694 [Pyrinomonadaceae bacterium]|jgi:hypothetical protein|nr:hypothetical protein [Pyrinomonadaceae bacterium]
MQTYYALIATGSSYTFANGAGHRFNGINGFMESAAENRVQAILNLYRKLSEDNEEVTALKTESQNFMLGLTAEEWDELSKHDIRIKEGYPEKAGVQIQAISETPFV